MLILLLQLKKNIIGNNDYVSKLLVEKIRLKFISNLLQIALFPDLFL